MAKNTTHEFPVYVAERDIEDLGRPGGTHIGVFVHGFWSDVISIYVRRDFFATHRSPEADPHTYWKFEVSHSSGGRDTAEEPDDIRAHDYFAMGIQAACQYARILRSQVSDLEKFYQLQCVVEKERYEAEVAAKAAAKEADPELGLEKAEELVAMAMNLAKSARRTEEVSFIAHPRGEEQAVRGWCARKGRDDVIRFFQGSSPVSKRRMEADLAKLSANCATVGRADTI